jgi:hypothetical protein
MIKYDLNAPIRAQDPTLRQQLIRNAQERKAERQRAKEALTAEARRELEKIAEIWAPALGYPIGQIHHRDSTADMLAYHRPGTAMIYAGNDPDEQPVDTDRLITSATMRIKIGISGRYRLTAAASTGTLKVFYSYWKWLRDNGLLDNDYLDPAYTLCRCRMPINNNDRFCKWCGSVNTAHHEYITYGEVEQDFYKEPKPRQRAYTPNTDTNW